MLGVKISTQKFLEGTIQHITALDGGADTVSLVIGEKVECLFENAGGFRDTFVKVCRCVLLSASIFSEMWKARSSAESASKGRLRTGML